MMVISNTDYIIVVVLWETFLSIKIRFIHLYMEEHQEESFFPGPTRPVVITSVSSLPCLIYTTDPGQEIH